MVRTRGQTGLERASNILGYVGRRAATGSNAGTKFGGYVGSSVLGGKTPSGLTLFEKVIDSGSKYFTDDERLRRLSEDKSPLPFVQNKISFEQKLEQAKAQRDKIEFERQRLLNRQYGTIVESSDKK